MTHCQVFLHVPECCVILLQFVDLFQEDLLNLCKPLCPGERESVSTKYKSKNEKQRRGRQNIIESEVKDKTWNFFWKSTLNTECVDCTVVITESDSVNDGSGQGGAVIFMVCTQYATCQPVTQSACLLVVETHTSKTVSTNKIMNNMSQPSTVKGKPLWLRG